MNRSFALLSLLLLTTACTPPPAPRDVLQGYGEARFTYIAAEEAGRINSVAIADGQTVAAGAVAFELDVTRMALAADSAAAAAAAASSRADRAGALAQAVRRDEAEAEIARQNLRRSRTLFERGLVAQARLDADTAAANAANAAVAQARAEQAAARTDAGGAGASARLAQRRVRDMRITIPRAGVIHMVYHRPGEVVAPGAPLAALIAAGDMRVRFFAPQDMLARLAPGARVTLACDGCPQGLTGRVSFVATEPQFTPPIIYSREQRAKLVFLVEAIPDDPAAIRPGLPIDVGLAP